MKKLVIALVVVLVLALAGGGVAFTMYRRAEAARLAQEAKAEQERLEREAKAEQERLEREKRAEERRIEREKQAEEARIAAEKQAELMRQQQEALKKAEAQRKWERFEQDMKIFQLRAEKTGESVASASTSFQTAPSPDTFAAMQSSIEGFEKIMVDLKSLAVEVKEFGEGEEFKYLDEKSKAALNGETLATAADLEAIDRTIKLLHTLRTGVRQEQIDIRADDGWQSIPHDVEDKETVCIQAAGQWKWATFAGGTVGPQGEAGAVGYRLEENLGNGALLARVEGAAQVYAGWGCFASPRKGRLQFRINDREVNDNTGMMHLSVWIIPYVDPSKMGL